jgi:lipoprotein-anchoring transpeptidase ErfK/SrfK
MKTTVILSCLLTGSLIVNTQHSVNTSAPATKSTKSKRALSKTMPIAPIQIIIDKSNYELYVYDKEGWFATYPVVFGNSSLDDKKMEGDRNTPEGSFKIASKRIHEKWDRYMGLDYPTKESLEKFKERKQRGEIPANASPGGGVGIHGTWPHEDYVIDRYQNWTNGCISLKNEDIEDLYSYISVGTPVTIRK